MNIVKTPFFAFVAIGLTLPSLAQTKQQLRPNILWLTFEDTSPQFIGCYGDSMAKTPVIDRLAKDGVRFTSAFSTGAVCSPSRFCIITGVRPTTMGTGNHRSNYPIPEYIKGFPTYLREIGYYTTNNSKTDYNTSNAKEIIAKSWDECSSKAGWWNRKPGQPFFAIYNSIASHQSRTMTNPWSKYEEQVLSKLDDNEKTPSGNLEMPAFYRNSTEMQKNFSRVYNSITLTDKEFGTWLDRLENDGLKDSTIIFCFSDHGEGIPRGKGSSVGMGYRVPFIVWFPPMYKHLSPWGSGIITDELISFEDLAPTLLSIIGIDIPQYMEGRPFIGSKRAEEKNYVYSSLDRTDENSDLCRSITDGNYIYTRVFTPFQPFVRWNKYYDVSDIQKQMRKDFDDGVLNQVQTTILKNRQCEYLFDLKRDKWEVNNLVSNRKYKKIINELSGKLKEHLVEAKDAHFIPEFTFKEYSKSIIPNKLRLKDSLYPANQVIETAWMNGSGERVVSKQVKALCNNNELVQYWAAVGLFSQEKIQSKYHKEISTYLKTVKYKPALVFLSGAVYSKFNFIESEYLLKSLILDSNSEIARLSMEVVMNLDEIHQRKLLETIHEAELKNRDNKYMDDVKDFYSLYFHKIERKPLNYESYY